MKLTARLLAGGATLLVVLMPFHAFISVAAGTLIGHREFIQAWKEVVVAIMLLITGLLGVTSADIRRRLLTAPNICAVIFVLIALAVSATNGVLATRTGWFGIKTDLVYLGAFVAAQAAAAPLLDKRLTKLLLGAASLVALIGLVLQWLPPEFLSGLGYGPGTIKPLQAIAGGARRAISTLGGPNQLGAFLILPICLAVREFTQSRRWWHIPTLILLISCLILTLSRSALIGAFVGSVITASLSLPRERAKQTLKLGVILAILAAIVVIKLPQVSPQVRYFVQHEYGVDTDLGSDDERLRAWRSGAETIRINPWGLGLGSAGPASFQGDNALITENYYLQLAVETGVIGLVTYLLFELLVVYRLYQSRAHGLAIPILGAMVGLMLVNLFLHGWADSSTALVFWTMAGLALRRQEPVDV